MSLRPVVYAADLGRLRKMFGSGDEALAEKVLSRLKERTADSSESAARLNKFADQVRQAIVDGAPVRGLRQETWLHVVAVDVLADVARLETPKSMVHDGDFKHFAWDEYAEEAGPALDKRARALLGYLVNGRPLLGRAMGPTGGPYYAYLENAEVRQLLDALVAAGEENPELDDKDFIDGFHGELVGWLRTILDRKKDLWLYAS